ncbi:MAG TPA: winged helix-turn-helix domain-containing protein [Terriglobales bacterium]|nr:winged helix-turn-helix domain-containing protein [Terriglobales bacterium]
MGNFADSMQRPLKIQSGENHCGTLTQEPRTPRCEAYRFDCFEASLRLGALLQRGERVRVQDLPFKMLVALLEKPGELVTKEELADRLWGQEIFTEIHQSLYVIAGKLRQVLGDDASQPRFIKTDSGKGYRFIASVTPVFAPVVEQSAPLSSPAEQTNLTVKRTFKGTALRLLAVVIVAALGTGLAAYKYEHRALMNDQDRVVVAAFTNSTGNADLDGTFSSALQSQLEQSPYINLIPDNRFRALVKSPESASLQDELRACIKLDGQVLLKGSILALGQGYQVTLSAWRCASGRLLTTEKAAASSQATILSALDLAGEGMRRRLGEPEASLRRFNVPTVQAATPSLAALRAFNLGEEKRFTGDFTIAAASYKLAVDLDPQFAIAYGRLGTVYYNTAQFALSAQAFQRAFELRDTRTSDRERLYIITLYYRFATGQIKQTIEDYELWRTLYPRDVAPIHNLAAQYLSIGQPQRALDLARQAFQLEPTDDNHYELLAEAYLRLGDFANVKKMCEDPARGNMTLMRFHLACFEAGFGQNDEVAMNRQLQWAHGNPEESEALDDSAWAAMYFGRISDARVLFRKAKDSAVQNKSIELAAGIELDRALLEADVGLFPAARTLAREVLKLPFEGASEQANVARVLARSGDTALALTIAKKAAGMAPLNDLINSTMLAMVRAAVYMQAADPARAVEALEESREFELCSCMQLAPGYYRGLAYLQNNQPELALRQFQQILDHRFLSPPFSVYLVLSQLELGHAYQLLGDSTSANSAFAKVEMAWKDADRNFPPLQKLRHYREQRIISREQYIASR